MTAKEYLQQAFLLDRSIKAKERQLEALKDRATYSTPQLDKEAQHSTLIKSRLEENTVKIVELEKSINLKVQEMERLRQEIGRTIEAVNNPECEAVLQMRYLSFMNWEEIASRLDISVRNVYRFHGKALSLVHVPQQDMRKTS